MYKESQYDKNRRMISVNKAREILSANTERGEKKNIQLHESLGLILAENVYSFIDVPSFNNSAMDGYAIEFDDKRREWEVVTSIQAGDTSEKEIKKGEAARIFTGAKMPEGADTVIPQELIAKNSDSTRIVYSYNKIKTGSNVRLIGSQCKKGELILKKGSRITPGAIGLLASVGLAEIDIYEPPGVGYIITGDELKEVGSPLREGEIYNSNGPMLEALLSHSGIKEISAYQASDEKEKLQEVISKALEQQDIIILSGGISVGDYDFVKECLEKAGVNELFYKIKQRPGKPMFAGKKGKKWVFALPGNPASVLSCFNQYVKPCLKYIMGEDEVWKPDKILPLAQDQKKKPAFTFFVKARTTGDKVEILGGQQSFNLQAFSTANCLVELDEEPDFIKAGTPLKIFYL